MIAVIGDRAEERTVGEFFELFKTPWEPYRNGRRYDVVLCAGNASLDDVSAKLLIIFGPDKTAFDADQKVHIEGRRHGGEMAVLDTRLPIYGGIATFRAGSGTVIGTDESGGAVLYIGQSGGVPFVRAGYDLFGEIRSLLTEGQPAANARIPSLEVHIALLRHLILTCGIPLVEIPPVPDGYRFITCLTHDMDHASIRRHKLDSTILGFLYRATVGSVRNTVRGRVSMQDLFTNFVAAAKLPFIYAGIAQDFWYEFDRYLEIEGGRPSTFFAIPFARRPGRTRNGEAPRARASAYDVSHVAEKMRRLKAAGCEIGLHGIDAWFDTDMAREEANRIAEVSSARQIGVRMHWLYGDENSAAVLEDADLLYDSTVGYNQTVGYRAGTSQVFRPLQAKRIFELPMHVMDTALFYPDYLNLSQQEAWAWLAPIFRNALHHGGVLTFNWHDRSIAPERLWGKFYVRLLDELTQQQAWFATAAQTVAWFRKRRSAIFEAADDKTCTVRVTDNNNGESLPALRLRFHRPGTSDYSDVSFDRGIQFDFSESKGPCTKAMRLPL